MFWILKSLNVAGKSSFWMIFAYCDDEVKTQVCGLVSQWVLKCLLLDLWGGAESRREQARDSITWHRAPCERRYATGSHSWRPCTPTVANVLNNVLNSKPESV